jgi:ABC-2 type transport system ATP-binding protein
MSGPAVALPATGRAVLAVDGVTKAWGPRTVLDGAALSLAPGSVTWLAGRNGAGKTTLLRIVAGILAPDTGDVAIGGRSVRDGGRDYRRRLGYLPAGNGGLYARLTVRHSLDVWARMALVPRASRAAVVDRTLAAFALTDLAAQRVDRLSTGQRQRVRLSLAFLHAPSLLLLDEPHVSLDDEALELLRAAVAERVADGAAVLWCSPPRDGEVLPATRAVVLDAGRVRET